MQLSKICIKKPPKLCEGKKEKRFCKFKKKVKNLLCQKLKQIIPSLKCKVSFQKMPYSKQYS